MAEILCPGTGKYCTGGDYCVNYPCPLIAHREHTRKSGTSPAFNGSAAEKVQQWGEEASLQRKRKGKS